MRVSMPGAPFGILEKSPLPSTFCSFMQKGQWSVEIACRSLKASPRQRRSCVSRARSGGAIPYFAPSESRFLLVLCDKGKDCGEGFAEGGQPPARASVPLSHG